MVIAVALTIATLSPLMFLYFVRALDIYRTGTLVNLAIGFGWGIIAYLLAAQVNPFLILHGWISIDNTIRFSAPVVEEILKGLALIYIVSRADFTYFVDGAIYGFAAGMGFAIIENFEYILNSPESALINAVARVLSTNLIHATGSGIIGIALGKARFDQAARRVLSLVLGLGLAIGLHMGFNNIVSRAQSGLLLVYAIIAGFAGAGYIIYNIKLGLKEEKSWIEEKLGKADRVTVQEAAAVQKLDDIQELLQPIVDKFGPEKATIVEDLLTMQAKLGILRKTHEKINDEKMQKAVEKQIDDLSAKMDAARKSVGSYCMLYLREIFMGDSNPLWQRLATIIQQRSQSGVKRSGPTLWSSLDKRINTPADSGKAPIES